uniref:Uncharacterized protein n=1 Tax=Anguilla anguilla TaxID=7936 RepID=A0A0E9PAN3_ANGAN
MPPFSDDVSYLNKLPN